jgi:protein-L-isoaspartate(D-aspartate) O-methyltransferase
MTDFERARRTMVDSQLQTSGVFDRRILGAMGQVPRELFVPEARRAVAYIDDTQPLDDTLPHRRLAAPAPFGRLVQLADVTAEDRVLVVGAGTGYSCAVLARLAASVVGVEPEAALAARARDNLSGLGVANAEIVEAPLDTAPKGGFDVILVEGAVEAVPPALLKALNDGGRLVCLLLSGPTAVAHVYMRRGGAVTARAEFNASLPPLAPARPADEFVF